MKRAFCIFLAVLFLIPCFSLAEDKIIGSWYFYYSKTSYPEFSSSYSDADHLINIYTFLEDGTILCTANTITGSSGTPLFSSVGKWENKFYGYDYSIIGLGSGSAMVSGDVLLLKPVNYDYAIQLRKLFPFDFYHDYIY